MKPYYETELGALYHGDCLEIMPQLGQVDMILTSPPYDNLRDYEGYSFNFYQTAWQIKRILKNGAVCVWVVDDKIEAGSESGTSFRQALFFKAIGLKLNTMIWNKGCFTSPQKTRYPNVFEYMLIISKGTPICNQIKDRINIKNGSVSTHTIRKKNGETKKMYADNRKIKIGKLGVRFNVWQVNPEQSNLKRRHPAQFPERLAMDHILSWSNEGDTVLDCMTGSGTTPAACERLKRKWVACEMSEKYCEITAKRIERETKQMKLF